MIIFSIKAVIIIRAAVNCLPGMMTSAKKNLGVILEKFLGGGGEDQNHLREEPKLNNDRQSPFPCLPNSAQPASWTLPKTLDWTSFQGSPRGTPYPRKRAFRKTSGKSKSGLHEQALFKSSKYNCLQPHRFQGNHLSQDRSRRLDWDHPLQFSFYLDGKNLYTDSECLSGLLLWITGITFCPGGRVPQAAAPSTPIPRCF